ncbi:MAG TPA: acyl-CoA dehydratase activase [Negativicutes bacterium]|nr:acyl-CoA dehydratase activase [Negativicutes bacterium]
MKIQDVIAPELVPDLIDAKAVGIDIGSRAAKAVLLNKGEIFTAIIPSGISSQESAKEVLEELFEKSGLSLDDIDYIVGTGYGRISLSFEKTPNEVVTEISCHAMGAHYLNSNTRTIIDIGGQDSKAIKVDPESGKVLEFIMNDKCAAGTGRFLEKVANLLDIRLEELGDVAVKATTASLISSQCVVFAESEVISLKAKGEKRENIAAGIHIATARRIRNLLNRIGMEPTIIFSGGVSNNIGMKLALEEVLGVKIGETKLDTTFGGALGAAIYAHKYALSGHVAVSSQTVLQAVN